MRNCYVCKENKNLEDFYKDKTQKSGYDFKCKKCSSELSKKRRLERPDYYREKQKKSLEKNYESIRESQRLFRLKNRDKINQRRRELREPKKKEINEKEKERRKNDLEFNRKQRILQKKWREKNSLKNKPKTDAHKLVMFSIKLGFMKRPLICSECGIDCKPEGHHEDYSKPLDVIWLCKLCHKQRHRKY